MYILLRCTYMYAYYNLYSFFHARDKQSLIDIKYILFPNKKRIFSYPFPNAIVRSAFKRKIAFSFLLNVALLGGTHYVLNS